MGSFEADMANKPTGEEKWDSLEITEQKALEEIGRLSNDEFGETLAKIHNDIEVNHSGANINHVTQVVSFANYLAKSSPELFPGKNELRLVALTAVLHDLEKDMRTNPGSLVTHAYMSAREIPEYLKRFIPDSENLGMFIARGVEAHSDIPFIEDNLTSQLRNVTNAKDAPRLVFEQKDGYVEYSLPTPYDKYSRLLRAADTLSNYGLTNKIEVPIPEGKEAEKPLFTYGGFIKIMGLAAGGKLSGRVENIISTAQQAIEAGVYDGTPGAKELAETSIKKMAWLQDYFRGKSELEAWGEELAVVDNELRSLAKRGNENAELTTHKSKLNSKLNEVYIEAFDKMEKVEF